MAFSSWLSCCSAKGSAVDISEVVLALAHPWDADEFQESMAEAQRQQDDQGLRRLLRQVASSNYEHVRRAWSADVCRTELVPCGETNCQPRPYTKDPQFTMSQMSTGDALLHFAAELQPRDKKACALNFANGVQAGGGYLNGARAQEEELCRQFPALYTSLHGAKARGHAYPFGPSTYRGGANKQRYADVLFTPRLVARRGSRAEGYRLLGEDEECLDNMALVSAAAPNVPRGEVFASDFLLEAIRTIVIAPKLKDKSVDTLILGAWGCGAFGCDPQTVASLFAQVLFKERLGRLYREVHFAIPGGANAQAFEKALRNGGLALNGEPARRQRRSCC